MRLCLKGPVIDNCFSVSLAKKKKVLACIPMLNAWVCWVLLPFIGFFFFFPDLFDVLGKKKRVSNPFHRTISFFRSLLNTQHDVSIIIFGETADCSAHKNTINFPPDKHLAPVLTFPDFSARFSSCSSSSCLLCLKWPRQFRLLRSLQPQAAGWEVTGLSMKGLGHTPGLSAATLLQAVVEKGRPGAWG